MWDKSIEGSCHVDLRKWYLGMTVPNILTDVALLILPFPYIKRLKTKNSQKMVLGGLFLLGGV